MAWRTFANITSSQATVITEDSGDQVYCIPFSWLDDNFSYLKDRIYIGSGSPVDNISPEQDKAWYFNTSDNSVWFWDGSSWTKINANYADSAGNADKVDNFHASQTPTANTIPVADANGYINDWINQGEGSGLDADLLRGLPADFTCSKTESGYTKLPNGLIIQWGKYEKETHFNNDEEFTITFPISFPNALLSFTSIVSPGTNDAGGTYMFVCAIKQNTDGTLYNFSQNGVTVKVSDVELNTPTQGKGYLFWIAIGY